MNHIFKDHLGETKNLVTEIHGRNPVKFARKCAKFIFRDESLQRGVIESSNRTQRTQLDPVRVQLIKRAVRKKYPMPEKRFDSTWALIKESVNGYCRTVGFRIRSALATVTNNM